MKKISIEHKDGTMEEYDLINVITLKEDNKNFLVYTKNEQIKDDIYKVYVSELVSSDGTSRLIGIADETTWEKVKQAMKEMVQGGQEA